MAGAKDFISGKHTFARVRWNNKPWEVKVKTTKVQELGEVVLDQVNGEKRARFQKLTDGFMVTLDCYDDGSSDIIANFIANQVNEDANLPQVDANVGLRFDYLDGSGQAWVFGGQVTLNPMEIDIGGRKERVMNKVAFHCQTFDAIPAA